MKIDSIVIKNFKSIKEAKIDLNKGVNVLIGPNGVGKTNFIQFFLMLNNIIEKNLQNYVASSGGAENLLHFGSKVSRSIFFNLDFGDNGYFGTLAPNTEDSLFFIKERAEWRDFDEYPYKYNIGESNRETKLFDRIKRDKEKKAAWHVAEAIKSWRVYHFHDTGSTSPIKKTNNINDNKYFRPDASNLAAFLYLVSQKHEDHFKQIESTIRLIAPFFGRFNLEPSALNEENIKLEWQHEGSDKYFNASHLSDGTLRMICLITLLMQPNPPDTIIIDEPELGLHPSAINLLGELIRSSVKKTQLIISTQSVELVNEFTPEDIIVVDRINNASEFRRLKSEELLEWLEEYSLGELWMKNILGGRP